MRLSRWLSISLIGITFAACTDSLDPNEIPGAYNLTDINGRALPTYEAPTPGVTRTITGAGLTIDFGDAAELTQAITQPDGTQLTITTHFTYRRQGHDLIFSLTPPCPANATCLAPPRGRVPGTHQVDLDFSANNIPIIYHFQRITLAY